MSEVTADTSKLPVPPCRERGGSGVLGRMLCLSLLLHILLGVAVKQGWVDVLPDLPKMKKNRVEEEVIVLPLTYVDVLQENATNDEVPDDTPFYGARSSVASNPDPVDTADNVPRIDGTREEMIRTETVVASSEDASPPVESAPTSAETAAENSETDTRAASPGDLALVRPEELAVPTGRPVVAPPQKPGRVDDVDEPAEQTRPKRPRRYSDLERGALTGEKMKMDGGVARYGVTSLFDVKGNVFGAYDEAMRIAVQDRWYSFLERESYAHRGGGRVTIKFTLHDDGRVTGGRIRSSTVDLKLGFFCLSAITDPAPFADWPEEMRRLIGSDRRELEFNFFYR